MNIGPWGKLGKKKNLEHTKAMTPEILKQSLNQTGFMKVTITSNSMEPVIMTGEEVIIASIPQVEKLEPFDILVFWNDEGVLTCHYVWHINKINGEQGGKTLVTRAMLNHEDLPFSENQILGKVVSHKIPWKLKLFLKIKYKDY